MGKDQNQYKLTLDNIRPVDPGLVLPSAFEVFHLTAVLLYFNLGQEFKRHLPQFILVKKETARIFTRFRSTKLNV
jgi:hypothetical protein